MNIASLAREHGISTATAYRLLKGKGKHVSPKHANFIKSCRETGFIDDNSLGKVIILTASQTQHTPVFQRELENELIKNAGCYVNCNIKNIDKVLENNQDAVGIIALDAISLKLPLPLVYLNVNPILTSNPLVACDEMAGVYKQVKFLKEKGHTKIAIFYDLFKDGEAGRELRRLCFPAVCRELGVEYRKEYVYQEEFEWDDHSDVIKRACDYFLGLQDRPTALLTSTDLFAMTFIDNFKSAGLKLPEDMSIIGFDAYEISEFVTPRLTTISKPIATMVKHAVKLLKQNIDNPGMEPVKILIEPELIERDSAASI